MTVCEGRAQGTVSTWRTKLGEIKTNIREIWQVLKWLGTIEDIFLPLPDTHLTPCHKQNKQTMYFKHLSRPYWLSSYILMNNFWKNIATSVKVEPAQTAAGQQNQ